MNRKVRIFFAFFAGNLFYFFFYSFLTWAFTALKITPYGRFVSTFFKGRTPDEAKEFIAGNHELFNELLPAAARFSNIVINPAAGVVLGIVAGMIMSSKGKSGSIIWSLIAAAPMAILFLAKAEGGAEKVLYLALFLLFSAAGGYIGDILIKRLQQPQAANSI
ncbi:MAG: hypothetical protein HY954_04880 [Deltaproteobacteria bacterium]|nr:hypothetical protein [Deltaproteobacteria bacterium]